MEHTLTKTWENMYYLIRTKEREPNEGYRRESTG